MSNPPRSPNLLDLHHLSPRHRRYPYPSGHLLSTLHHNPHSRFRSSSRHLFLVDRDHHCIGFTNHSDRREERAFVVSCFDRYLVDFSGVYDDILLWGFGLGKGGRRSLRRKCKGKEDKGQEKWLLGWCCMGRFSLGWIGSVSGSGAPRQISETTPHVTPPLNFALFSF
ncbi:hypothetical protein K435DRAFT_72716 [Dendrothele bispora CBS 962.96]|uniref:Uncharacterized protein n=1 Tax=Dendrothele bispora (strain CBS 962.96) TaxID=1314807 RepID=A0A4S8M4J7_DENBC|nr:hypothetical protein K435DRAFT_127585 [Dendrothele bispora CBS 962.96]THU97107.1 hypothetical protein K435DRAFT_72716 [Dendrothele bispora CBS 962.96]